MWPLRDTLCRWARISRFQKMIRICEVIQQKTHNNTIVWGYLCPTLCGFCVEEFQVLGYGSILLGRLFLRPIRFQLCVDMSMTFCLWVGVFGVNRNPPSQTQNAAGLEDVSSILVINLPRRSCSGAKMFFFRGRRHKEHYLLLWLWHKQNLLPRCSGEKEKNCRGGRGSIFLQRCTRCNNTQQFYRW